MPSRPCATRRPKMPRAAYAASEWTGEKSAERPAKRAMSLSVTVRAGEMRWAVIIAPPGADGAAI